MAKRSGRKRIEAVPALAVAPRPAPAWVSSRPPRGPVVLQALVIGAVTFWIFFPSLHGGWQWDDRAAIVDNAVNHNPDGLWKIWCQPGGFPVYYPLVESVDWLQFYFWPGATFPLHLTNVILHILNALLVWRLLAQFGLRYAWLGGLQLRKLGSH